jgi:hypothetical protein
MAHDAQLRDLTSVASAMKATRNKLDEAHFFLQQVETNYLQNPAFDYYLSAFISSARSVLWIMRSEYHDVSGWESWYESRKPTLDEELLLKKTNDIRVYSEKKGALKTNFQVSINISKERLTEELRHALEKLPFGKKLTITVAPIDGEWESSTRTEKDSIEFVGNLDKVSRALNEPFDDDTLDACRKYYHFLEQIVFECETHFG